MNLVGGERDFPVYLATRTRLELVGVKVPASVPWDFVAHYRERALTSFGHPLEVLAQRGGLSPWEILTVVCDRECPASRDDEVEAAACIALRDLVDAWRRARQLERATSGA